jgi:hypothetical protein
MHTTKVDFIFKALEVSKVSFTDFSRLTRISRESLYRWKDGAKIGDQLRLDLAYNFALRLEKACREGKLPLTERHKAPARIKLLRQIVADMGKKV